MSEWWRVILYALVTLFLGVILKEVGFKGSKLVFLLGTVGIIGASVIYIGKVIDTVPALGEVDKEYAVAMLKIIGVGYAFGICSDICEELGEVTLSGAVSLFGRVEIITLSLPFIKRIIEKGVELI